MDKEKWNKVCKIVQRIKSKKWAQEMDDVEIVVVDKSWVSKVGYYDYRKRPPRIVVSGLRTVPKIEKTIYHELAHHIEYRHALGFIRYRRVCHSANFYTIFKRLLLIDENFSLKEIIDKLYSYSSDRAGWVWDATKTCLLFKRN